MQREVPLLLLISFESSLNVCTMSMQMVLVAFCSLIPLAECEWYVENKLYSFDCITTDNQTKPC